MSDKKPKRKQGNLDSFFSKKSITEFKSVMNPLKKYLETCSSNAMYTSPLIQNEIINIFGELIQSEIIKKISKSNYFSVLAVETTDIAQIEQFSICIRYFEEELVVLREDFLTFVPVHDVTGLGLATVLLNTLKELGLDLDKLRGQGYDGAATMSGNFRGVQAIVKMSYPKALYTHCVSHSLNLCLSDAAKTQAILNALDRVNQVKIQLQILRDNATDEFYKIYEEVNRLGGLINVEENKPYSNLKTAVTFYQNDLKGYDDIIEVEYQLWQSKWNSVDSRPLTAIEALHQCDKLMYPNMYELLKILSILPVSTATAERSFSTLRRLKNYLRNTTSESLLVGLALLSIHRDVNISDDMALDNFSNSGKARRIKLTI
ncbi:PREDICTED: uncharacterized protein LOC107172083 [Diuraphis noxia]|uniref:uncharacterized protein LOC107172083 n=1 Tax=Diuraphis noxia TaxID=143948 RepID=UPI000763A603|nr:PREDICTED: uncharacterized protein LOC107172083 [Diuraphis noxia]